MDFQIGDQVVHKSYGPGEIIQLEEKELSNQKTYYYVVRIGDLTLWSPVGEAEHNSLRLLTPAAKFEKLYGILSDRGEPLSTDRMERKTQLTERMKEGQLDTICEVIRDLSLLKQTKKLSETDVAIFKRAQTFLLKEWSLSLSVPVVQADQALQQLLSESLTKSV